MSTNNKTTPVIIKGSGDQPAETEGHVQPGKSLRERWGVETPAAAAKPPEKTEAELEAERAAAAAPAPAVKPAPKGKKKTVIPPRAPTGQFVSPKEIAEIAEAVVSAGKKKDETPKPAVPESKLDAKQQKKVKVLQRMEVLNPALKGIADKFTAATIALAEYQQKWEKDAANKGKKFNIEEPEHADFLAEHDVQYDPDEYAEALADIRADERMKPVEEKFKTQEAEQQRQQRIQGMIPKVISHQRATAKVYVDQLGDDFKGLLNEGGIVVPEVRDKILAEGTIEQKQVMGMAGRVETMAAELMAVANDLVKFDAKNPLHVEMFQFIQRQEEDTKKLPAEQQLNGEGKMFATSQEWAQMSERERADHWHLSDTDLSALYASEMADTAKTILDAAEKDRQAWAKRKGLLPNGAASAPAPAAPVKSAAAPVQRERSPVGQIAPRVAPVGEAPKTGSSELIKRWTS